VDKSLDPLENPEISSSKSLFRLFWGNKCELRRFQDGSIVEAVVWDANPLIGTKDHHHSNITRGAV
jgi:U3 small nucleolar RNA-associated protein 22